MDATVRNDRGVSQSEDRAAVVSSICEKRHVENGESGDLTVRPWKKPRCKEEMKSVAEIVLVLSAMGRMRGGKSPTQAELEMMAECRAKLLEMCQRFAPKDIVGRDEIEAVIEDLGLNGKLKDQRLGFRAPRLTISEKLAVAKRKMEEFKKYPAASPAITPNMPQPGIRTGAGKMGISSSSSVTHTVCALPSDKTDRASVSAGGIASHMRAGNQWLGNEVRAPVFNTSANSHYTRDSHGLAQPRIKSDRSSSALPGNPQGQVSLANHTTVNAPTWPVQTQSTSSARPTADNKVPNQISFRAGDQSFRPLNAKTAQGSLTGMNQPMQGFNKISPSGNNHAEIAKTVQRLLQPRVHQNLPWNPPSREYMNKAMTCQICQVTINDAESVLICDACEKGYHLKCLQENNMKGIPKFEWHCTRCVQLCNGKPFPPKYGRVMRSMNPPKVPSNTSEAQSPTEKKVGTMDSKVNQQKTSVQVTPGFQGPPEPSNADSKSSEPNSQSENSHPSSNVATDATSIAAGRTASDATPNAISSVASNVTASAGVNETTNAPSRETIDATSDAITGLQGTTGENSSEPICSAAETPLENDSCLAISPENGTKLPENHSVPSVAALSESLDHDVESDAELSIPQEKSDSQIADSVSHGSNQFIADLSSQ